MYHYTLPRSQFPTQKSCFHDIRVCIIALFLRKFRFILLFQIDLFQSGSVSNGYVLEESTAKDDTSDEGHCGDAERGRVRRDIRKYIWHFGRTLNEVTSFAAL